MIRRRLCEVGSIDDGFRCLIGIRIESPVQTASAKEQSATEIRRKASLKIRVGAKNEQDHIVTIGAVPTCITST